MLKKVFSSKVKLTRYVKYLPFVSITLATPSTAPTKVPTIHPTDTPTMSPTLHPSLQPTGNLSKLMSLYGK